MRPGQQRRKYINQRSKTKIAVVDTARRDWCREQECIARVGWGPCRGRVVPHHAGKKPGMGMKSGEDTTVPCCDGHHEDITGKWGGYGVFDALGAAGRSELQDGWIAETTSRYLSAGNRRSRR
jgi:hypothetical protein